MKHHPRPQGLLLAGGSSRRFGRDKLTEPVGGRPLLSRPLSVLSEFCAYVFVSVATGRKAAMGAFLAENNLVVSDVLEDETVESGPLAGIREGFLALDMKSNSHDGPGSSPLLVLAADLPAVSHTTISALLRAYEEVIHDPRRPAVVAARAAGGAQAAEAAGAAESADSAGEGRIQPLCAIWMPSVLPIITAHLEAGQRSVFGVLDKVDLTTVDVSPSELININRPSDLDLLG